MAAIIHYVRDHYSLDYDEYIVILDKDPEEISDKIKEQYAEPYFKVIGIYKLENSGCLPANRSLHI